MQKKPLKKAKELEQMMSTIFTKIGIKKGNRVVVAVKTKEGAEIKIINPEYVDRIAGLEQQSVSILEELDELGEFKQRKTRHERIQNNTSTCLMS